MKALLNWIGRFVNEMWQWALWLHVLTNAERREAALFAAVRIVEKICPGLIQSFQCSALKAMFEVPPEDAYRNVILDLQTSELLPTQLGAAL